MDKSTKLKTGIIQSLIGKGFARTLILWFLIISLLPLIAVSTINYLRSYKTISNKAKQSLLLAAENKAHDIHQFFQYNLTSLLITANQKTIINMVKDFELSYSVMNIELKNFVKSPEWELLSKYHGNSIDFLITANDYYDFFLIDKNGNVLYTDEKKNNLGINLFKGKYSNTGLAKSCQKSFSKEYPVFSDFEKDIFSKNKPAAFICTLVIDEEGNKAGLIASQISNRAIDKVMRMNHVLESGGETYLIGPDLKMRSNSIRNKESTILKQLVKTPQTLLWKKYYIDTDSPLKSVKQNAMTYINQKGIKVLGLYKPIEFAGVRMAVIAEIPLSISFKSAFEQRNLAILLLIFTVFFVIILALIVTSSITKPIIKLTYWANRIASGDLTYDDKVYPNNEIGQLVNSFQMVVTTLKNVAKQTDRISKGDFTTELVPRSKKDEMVISIIDMTESLKEKTIREQEIKKNIEDQLQLTESLKQGIPDPFFIVNVELTITYMNKACAELTGFNVDEVVGKMKCSEVFHAEICQTDCIIKKCINNNFQLTGYKTIIKNKQGKEIPIEISAGTIMDATGKIMGGFEICRNITTEVEEANKKQLQTEYMVKQVNNSSFANST